MSGSPRDYDDIVIGAGAGGLTAALLLSLLGRRVALVEKAPDIGGSLARFHYRGHEFETGFHFTGGLQPGGVLSDMFRVLGLRDAIKAVPLLPNAGQLVYLESEGRAYEIPVGLAALRELLSSRFPEERGAIAEYWRRMEDVCRQTGATDLRAMSKGVRMVEEDYLPLRQVLDQLTPNASLKALLSLMCMCHGTRPAEISFANHSRVSYALHDSITRIDGGGRTLVEAFRQALRAQSVDILCGRTVRAMNCTERRRCDRLVLSTGDELSFENVLFTLHPRAVLDTLPRQALTPAFRERVMAFEPTVGFCTVFAVLRGEHDTDWSRAVATLLPHADVDQLLDPVYDGDGAVVVMGSDRGGVGGDVIQILEATPVDRFAAWQSSRTGHRPRDYQEYKDARTKRILERLDAWRPGFAHRIEVIATATPLTYRDYLHSPDGSAYGVRQKVGQIGLYGRLPVRNVFAAGQSAVLPGLVGTMMASFSVCRGLVRAEAYDALVERALTS